MMTWVNWSLTILGVLIFVFGAWPGYGTEIVTQWIVGISAVLVLIIAWTGVICKPCAIDKKVEKKK